MVVAIISRIVILLWLSSKCSFIKCSPKTYDLVRYSRVAITNTYNTKQIKCRQGDGGHQEKRDGGATDVCLQATNTQEISDEFKDDIWKKEGAWSVEFEENQNEIDLDVSFYRVRKYSFHFPLGQKRK